MTILTVENITEALHNANADISDNIMIEEIVELHSPIQRYQLIFNYKDGANKTECDELITKVLMRNVSNPPDIVHGFSFNSMVFEDPVTTQVINNLMEDCNIEEESYRTEPLISMEFEGFQAGEIVTSVTYDNKFTFYSSISKASGSSVDITLSGQKFKGDNIPNTETPPSSSCSTHTDSLFFYHKSFAEENAHGTGNLISVVDPDERAELEKNGHLNVSLD